MSLIEVDDSGHSHGPDGASMNQNPRTAAGGTPPTADATTSVRLVRAEPALRDRARRLVTGVTVGGGALALTGAGALAVGLAPSSSPASSAAAAPASSAQPTTPAK